MYRYDGNILQHFNSANSDLLTDEITCLALDSASGLLVGFSNGCVQRYDTAGFTTLIQYNIGNNSVMRMLPETPGQFWVCTGVNGLYKYDNGLLQEFNYGNSGIASNYVTDIHKISDNSYWITTDSGLVNYSGGSWVTYTAQNSGLPYNKLTALEITDDSTLWIGSHKGLFSFKNNTFTEYNACNSLLSDNYVMRLKAHPDGRLFVGTPRGLDIITFDVLTRQIPFTKPPLLSVYPNPSGNHITFEAELAGDKTADLLIYQTTGQLVYARNHVQLEGDRLVIQFNPTSGAGKLPAGIYFYKLIHGGEIISGKFILQ